MSLSRYAQEILRVTDELLEYLTDPVEEAAVRFLLNQGESGLTSMTEEEQGSALTLLRQTPSQRDKSLAKRDTETTAKLILRARYLGLNGYRAIQMATQFEFVVGKGYREATVHCALAARRDKPVTLWDVLPCWGEYETDPRPWNFNSSF